MSHSCSKKENVSTVTLNVYAYFFMQVRLMKNSNSENLQYKSEYKGNEQIHHTSSKIGYSSVQRKSLFLWMASASEQVLCEVMKSLNPAPHKKLMGPDKARLHALLVAAEGVRSRLERTTRKNDDADLGMLDAAHELHLEFITQPKARRSPKREKVALHEWIIRQLFARGLSLRQVCTYLKRHAGLNVSHGYLRHCCLEMGIQTPSRAMVSSDEGSQPGGSAHEKGA